MRSKSTASVTIASGASLSGAVNLGEKVLSAIIIPGTWTAAALSFQTSEDGTTWYDLRDDAGVHAITDRVRGHLPGPNDARGPGDYTPFVVVIDLGGAPLTKVPVHFPRVVVRCYGVTPQGAKALYVACSNAVHDQGPRKVGTVGFYRSKDATGGDEGADPRTKQPYVEFTVEYIAATAAVA